MFTGLIRDMGTITRLEQRGDLLLDIIPDSANFPLSLGASIACHGICLTVTAIGGKGFNKRDASWQGGSDSLHGLDSRLSTPDSTFTVALSAETLRCTHAAQWQLGQRLNLEPSLCVGDPLGGHFVSGHVDGVATALRATPSGDSTVWEFSAPASLAPFIAAKGSVALDGVSLTVNEVASRQSPVVSKDAASTFTVNIIAHTAQHTSFGAMRVGDAVHLEIDMLARYVARILEIRA